MLKIHFLVFSFIVSQTVFLCVGLPSPPLPAASSFWVSVVIVRTVVIHPDCKQRRERPSKSSCVFNLHTVGVTFNRELPVAARMSQTASCAFYHVTNPARLRPLLSCSGDEWWFILWYCWELTIVTLFFLDWAGIRGQGVLYPIPNPNTGPSVDTCYMQVKWSLLPGFIMHFYNGLMRCACVCCCRSKLKGLSIGCSHCTLFFITSLVFTMKTIWSNRSNIWMT